MISDMSQVRLAMLVNCLDLCDGEKERERDELLSSSILHAFVFLSLSEPEARRRKQESEVRLRSVSRAELSFFSVRAFDFRAAKTPCPRN